MNKYTKLTSVLALMLMGSAQPILAQSAPSFTLQPLPVTTTTGQTIILTAAATGDPAPTLEWNKIVNSNRVPVTDNERISGAATPELTITNATLADAGQYQLLANNGTIAYSNIVDVKLTATAGGATYYPFGINNSFGGSLAPEASPVRVGIGESTSYFVPGTGPVYLENTFVSGVLYSKLADLSDDGTLALISAGSGNHPPRIYTIATGESTAYPALPSFPWGEITGINFFHGVAFADNGNFVGQIQDQNGQNRGIFYNAETETYTLLGTLPNGDIASNPVGLSADGTTVAGYERTGLFNGPFIWTEENGFTVLPDSAAFAALGDVRAISPSGRYIVGLSSAINGQGFSGTTSQRWDRGESLGAPVPAPFTRSYGMTAADAFTVNDDGTAGGFMGQASVFSLQEAVVWLPNGTRVPLAVYLKNKYGLETPGHILRQVTSISPDRRVLVGTSTNGINQSEGWVIELPEPLDLPEDGLMTVFNFSVGGQLAPGDALLFQNRAIGASDDRSLVLQNGGLEVLGGISATITGTHEDDFSINTVNLPDSRNPDQTSFLSLKFTPTAEGVRTATLNILSDDPLTPSFSVTLTGTGLPGLLSQTITFDPLPAKLTTDGAFDVAATASSELPVSFSIFSGPASISGSTITLTGEPGTVIVRASQAGNATYAAAPFVDQSFQVTAPATGGGGPLVLENLQQTYTGTPRPVTVTGGPDGSTIIVTYKGETTPPTNAGSYSVVATVEGTKTKKTGKLVIAKAPLTLTVDNKQRFMGQENPELTFSYSGFVNGDTAETALTKQPKITTTAKLKSPGGSYPIKASGAASVNYALTYVNGIMTVESFGGRYEALLAKISDSRPGAKVELTVAKNGSSFTGKLTVPQEAAALPFKGSLTVDPGLEDATAEISITSKKTGLVYDLALALPLKEAFSAQLAVDDVAFAGTLNGQLIYIPARGDVIEFAGAHTLVLAPGVPAADTELPLPEGSGHGIVTVDKKAVMKVVGRLADGTSFTASLAPDSQAGYRLFAQPYKRAESYIAGGLDLAIHPDMPERSFISVQSATQLAWAKAAGPKDKSYIGGFGVLDTQVTLDPWIKPTKAKKDLPAITLAALLGLDQTGAFTVSHSSIASPSDSDLPVALAMDVVKNSVTVTDPAANPTQWKVKFNASTGAFTGSFSLADAKTRKVNFTGVLRQAPSTDLTGIIGRGRFLLPALPTDPTKEIQSGDVRFDLPAAD
ncbi:MBG domain-containing protein [Prosthecobacter sp. SYSU 5D2]|uniref:MBG domain-containing protein n=1 Tax=Prosthecobacter sp. SYSU 5D2 TaxID=3134134 RepID=UPI0031FEBE9B